MFLFLSRPLYDGRDVVRFAAFRRCKLFYDTNGGIHLTLKRYYISLFTVSAVPANVDVGSFELYVGVNQVNSMFLSLMQLGLYDLAIGATPLPTSFQPSLANECQGCAR